MVPGNKKPLDEKLSQFVFVQFCIFIIEMSQCLPSGEEWIFHLVPDRQELGVDIDFPSGSNFVTDQTRLTFSLLNYLSLSLGPSEIFWNGPRHWQAASCSRERNTEECS